MIRLMQLGAMSAAAVTVAMAGAACRSPRASADQSSPPVVSVVKIGRGDLAETLTLAAEFRPYQEIDVHAKVAGYLASVAVDKGQSVKEGEVLAQIEVGAGNLGGALALLEDAVAGRESFCIFLKSWMSFKPLRAELRFRDLVVRVGLES